MKVEVKDRKVGWDEFFESAAELKGGAYAKVGVLEEHGGGDEWHADGEITVAELAAVHEFGTEDGRIPERSFIRSTYDEKREELEIMAKKLLAKIITKHQTVKSSLDILGLKLATEIKKKIMTGPGLEPPLAQSTIDRKGSSRPLVDTGQLVNAITWIVEKGE